MSLHASIIFRQRVLTQLTVNENLPVYNLKSHIAKSTNIPIRDQTLTFDGVVLEDALLLRAYKLPSIVDIIMSVPLSCPIKYKIYITTPFRNRPMKLRTRMERTLGEIKKIIEQHEQVSSNQQIIVHDCCIFDRVDDAKTLAELGITANTELEVILRHNVCEAIDGDKGMCKPSKAPTTLAPLPRHTYAGSSSDVFAGRCRPKQFTEETLMPM
ncbi:hypothetical protein TcWFU_007286 [Taenia crassiceps]|uniref:Ubiquitin-like domain-containing protein n=1 Tax=Taenia crassiceps TaxID=6207 RepID=A0ABR4QST6_9CEST